MQDLSGLLPGDPITALVPTSQAAGNMMSDRPGAMSAPGSEPVDPLPPAKDQGDPKVTTSDGPRVTPGTDGKQRTRTSVTYSTPPRPAWGKTTVPEVARES